MSDWEILYKKAIYPDGTLLFPERLSKEFLDSQRRVLGSYLFANQYLNEVIPDEERRFKKEWIRTFDELPETVNTFAFIDPAIGQEKHHDFTGVVVVSCSVAGDWYLRVASHYKLTPSEVVEKIFEIQKTFNCFCIGIETVAYQEALLYILDEQMKNRQQLLPVKGIKRSNISKESRILGLIPRFEWGKMYVSRGLTDFEDEYLNFPRCSHDDILDALASCEEIVVYPQKKEIKLERPNSPADPNYERWYIQNELGKSSQQSRSSGDTGIY